MNQTYIRILRAIELFASEHLQIKKFSSDFPEQMPNFATKDEAYPILYVSPSNAIFNLNTNRFDLRVFCYDVIQKDRENINTILSDTNSILNDLVLWLREGDLVGIDLVNEPRVTPINNELLDYVAGWELTLTLEVDTYTVCDIPFNETPIVTDIVNNIVYASYLTCDTLAECDTFNNAIDNLQEQINNISGGTEFDCNQLSGCTVIQDINSELSGLTTQINEISATTESIQENYVPYTGATQDVNLDGVSLSSGQYINVAKAFQSEWNNGESNGNLKLGLFDNVRGLYIQDNGNTNMNFTLSRIDGLYSNNFFYDENDIYNAGSLINTIYSSKLENVSGSKFGRVETSQDIVSLSIDNSNYGQRLQLKDDSIYNYISNLNTSESNELSIYTDRVWTKKYVEADEGFVSTWGDNGTLRLARPYDGITKEFVYYGGKGNYALEDQIAGIYANSDEGVYLNMFGTSNGNPITNSLNVSTQGIFVSSIDETSENNFAIRPNGTFTDKEITTNEGFYGNHLQLNTGATETSAVGKFNWNDADGTVDLGLKGGNVTLQLGQESVVRVVNKTATNIDLLESNYQAVRITGAQGNRLKVDLAQANNDLNSAETIGIVTETIANNQEGFITTNGLVRGINTTGSLQGETWADGDMLYLSPTVAGRLTKIKPVAPQHLVVIGYVVRAHVTQGQIFVKVDNGYELDELHNVRISGETNNNVLTYNGSTQVWENKTLNEITGTYNVKITTPSSIVSGTTSEVQLLKLEIPPYSFGPNDVLNIPNLIISKVGTIASYTLRVKISTSSTMPIGTGTDTIAFMSIGNTNTLTKMYRNYFISGGFLRGVGTINSASDVVNSTTALLVKAFDYTTTNYLYVSVNPASASDTFQLVGLQINNI